MEKNEQTSPNIAEIQLNKPAERGEEDDAPTTPPARSVERGLAFFFGKRAPSYAVPLADRTASLSEGIGAIRAAVNEGARGRVSTTVSEEKKRRKTNQGSCWFVRIE